MFLKWFYIYVLTRGLHTELESWLLPPLSAIEAASWHNGLKQYVSENNLEAWDVSHGHCEDPHCAELANIPYKCLCCELTAKFQQRRRAEIPG